MRVRRAHQKSKNGCIRCKQRKVKCDEVRPKCGNCIKNRSSCSFTVVSEQASQSLSIYQNPSETRMLDLRIMHHYTTVTARSLIESFHHRTTALYDVWDNVVPLLAFQSPVLLDAVMSLAAFHMRLLMPQEERTIAMASDMHMARTLSEYKVLIAKGIDAKNAESIWLTGAFIGFHTSASRRVAVKQSDAAYTLPTAIFRVATGVMMAFESAWQWLRDGKCLNAMMTTSQSPPVPLNGVQRPYEFFEFLLEGLEDDLQMVNKSARDDTEEAYSNAVAFLSWAVQASPVEGLFNIFPHLVTKRFVDMLSQGDPRTLCITAYYFAMTKAMDDWWLCSDAKYEVYGIMTLLPQEWLAMVALAVEFVNLEEAITEDVWTAHWARASTITTHSVPPQYPYEFVAPGDLLCQPDQIYPPFEIDLST